MVGLISFIIAEAAKGQLNQKSIDASIEVAQTILKLLGNASMHANWERRKSALQSIYCKYAKNDRRS